MDTVDELIATLPAALARHRQSPVHSDWKRVIEALGRTMDSRAARTLAAAFADAYSPTVLALNQPLTIGLTTGEVSGREVAYEESYQLRKALRQLGAHAVEPLLQLLQSKQPALRAASCAVLSEIADPRSIGPLVALLGDQAWADPKTRVNDSAVRALKAAGLAAAEALSVAAQSSDETVRRRALEVMSAFSAEARARFDALGPPRRRLPG